MNTKLLHGIGNDVVNAIVTQLGTHFRSGDLSNSISYEVTSDGKILIKMLPYWKYVEYGTPGQKQGVTSEVDGKVVSLSANPNRKMPVKKEGDEFKTYITGKNDFALAKHIQLYGTQAYPFVRPVIYHKLNAIIKDNVKRHAV